MSVREIAKAAGVNHGLIHRHFGSKEGLIKAAIAEISREIHQGDPIAGGISAWTFRYLRSHPEFAQTMARACLDNQRELLAFAAPDPQRLAAIISPIRELLERTGMAQQVDSHVVNALATAAFLGWFVFKPLLRSGFGIPSDADDQVQLLLEKLDALIGPR